MSRALPLVFALLVLVSLPALAVTAGPSAVSDAQTGMERDGSQTGTERDSSAMGPPASSVAATLGTADGEYATPVPVDGLNTTERIDFDAADVVTGFETTAANVGTTLRSDVTRIDARFETLRFQEAFESAESNAERRQLLTGEIEALEAALAEEQANEQQAYLAYHRGEISANELLVALAQAYVRAETIGVRAGIVLEVTNEVPDVSDAEVRTIQTATSELTGPVRANVVAALAGTGPSDRAVYVQAAENGIVLSTIDDNTFVREVYRADNRDPSQPDSLGSVTSAGDRATELYPWTFAAASGTDVTLSGDVYRVRATHLHGTLTTYLDGGTQAAFREIQEMQLDRIPVAEAVHSTEANRTVVVERTYPGGPARVTVLDDDGEPLDGAEIYVDDRLAGVTDENGERWIVAPRGGYDVTVVHQNAMSSVSVAGG